MAVKQTKCCCCPECTINGLCCKCIPKTLCFTYEGEYSTCSVQLEYGSGENGWQGILGCDGLSIDIYLYYQSDEYTGCNLYFRSEDLGYPEGYELLVDTDYSACQGNLYFRIGNLWWEPAIKNKPLNCVGCKCLCDCICLFVTHPTGEECTGRLCWVYEDNAWVGTVTCRNPSGGPDSDFVYDARVEWHPKGELCDLIEDRDPYCNPYDLECIPVLFIPDLGIVDAIPEQLYILPCEEQNVNFTWSVNVGDDYEPTVVTMQCSGCGEECILCSDCGFGAPIPTVLFLTFDDRNGEQCACLDGLVVPLPFKEKITVSVELQECELVYQGTFTNCLGGEMTFRLKCGVLTTLDVWFNVNLFQDTPEDISLSFDPVELIFEVTEQSFWVDVCAGTPDAGGLGPPFPLLTITR
jgi:hypothetical protein